MSKEIILQWLDEIASEKPSEFQEYFYEDVVNFIIEKKANTKKINTIYKCKNKNEVKDWLNEACGYTILHLDTDLLLDNYFN